MTLRKSHSLSKHSSMSYCHLPTLIHTESSSQFYGLINPGLITCDIFTPSYYLSIMVFFVFPTATDNVYQMQTARLHMPFKVIQHFQIPVDILLFFDERFSLGMAMDRMPSLSADFSASCRLLLNLGSSGVMSTWKMALQGRFPAPVVRDHLLDIYIKDESLSFVICRVFSKL